MSVCGSRKKRKQLATTLPRRNAGRDLHVQIAHRSPNFSQPCAPPHHPPALSSFPAQFFETLHPAITHTTLLEI